VLTPGSSLIDQPEKISGIAKIVWDEDILKSNNINIKV
jgi:hypothetical protein